jgi:opacity protein-like surface antigen
LLTFILPVCRDALEGEHETARIHRNDCWCGRICGLETAPRRWLRAYITGGFALQGAKTTLTTPLGPVCGGIFSGCSATDRAIGAALGAGIEYGFTPNLSPKVEFLYVTGASLEISRTSEIRGGLNYRFTGL